MIQHRIVQHHHSRAGERAAVDVRVEAVVAQVIERRIAAGGRHLDASVAPQFGEQRRRVVGHPRAGGRKG